MKQKRTAPTRRDTTHPTFSPATLLVATVALSLLALTGARTATGAGKRTRYKRIVPLQLQSVRFAGACHLIYTTMSSGDFFEGLERHETQRGTVFRKGLGPVDQFPKTILLEIKDTVTDCPPPTLPPRHGIAAQVMGSLRGEANWEIGTEVRAVEGLTLRRVSGPLEEFSNIWIFEIEVPSVNVPLTGRLTVDLRTKEGAQLVRILAKL
jgi:hypothetical protein